MKTPKMNPLALLPTLALLAASAGLTAHAETGPHGGNEQMLLSSTRQLIFEGRRSGEGYFSADGRQMIFQSEREADNPFYQMYLMDLETGDTHRVSTGIGKTTCGWIHPSGRRVLFASTHEDPEARAKQQEELDKRARGEGSRYSWSFDQHYDIYEADTPGKLLRNLTASPGYDAEGSWSPDGTLIAFASNRSAYQGTLSPDEQKKLAGDPSYFMDIYLMDADGANLRRLTDSPGYDGGPFFSPDGQRIVWRRFDEKGVTAEIWTMRLDGTDKRQVTRLGVMSWAPYYHPSGDYIVFATNAQGYGNFELYLVDAEGRSEPVRVTETEGFDGLPVFSPDGKRLAWASARGADRKAQIHIADWNDAAARELLGLGAPGASRSAGTATDQIPDPAATSPEISASDLRQHVGYLASERLAGRLTGSEGSRLASDYVAGAFAAAGLHPAGDMGDWFQHYGFTAGVGLGSGNRLSLRNQGKEVELEIDKDWRPLVFSGTGEVEPGEVVFAGYGIVAPGSGDFPAYDSYGDLDVTGKWVLVLRFLPEDITPEHRQYLYNYSNLRFKAMLARERGARGLIVVSGPRSGVKEELVPLRFEAAAGSGSLPAVSLADGAAQQILGAAGKNLESVQSELDKGTPVPGFAIPDVTLAANLQLDQQKAADRNVLGRLYAGEQPATSLVVIGAHLDHIGLGEHMDSRASGEELGKAHLGADDNASGVAALLEIAHDLAEQRRAGRLELAHDILFATWSGEEMGRLGSEHFVKTFAAEGEADRGLTPSVIAYLNLDMVGRLDEQLYLQGAGSSSVWSGEIERRNAPVGLPIRTQDDSYLPTDATSFYLKGIPILSAFTGSHPEYNTPRDAPDTLNYEGLERITRFMALLTRSLAAEPNAPDYVATEKPESKASRASLRAYLGTIPDYTETDRKGVLLNGVAKGGPAEQGGLQAGDLIVELAGRPIENIYDFTYALNALKVGQPVKVKVLRQGETRELEVTPGSRE